MKKLPGAQQKTAQGLPGKTENRWERGQRQEREMRKARREASRSRTPVVLRLGRRPLARTRTSPGALWQAPCFSLQLPFSHHPSTTTTPQVYSWQGPESPSLSQDSSNTLISVPSLLSTSSGLLMGSANKHHHLSCSGLSTCFPSCTQQQHFLLLLAQACQALHEDSRRQNDVTLCPVWRCPLSKAAPADPSS